MSSFSKAGVSYLVRSKGGVYYWQAKIGGQSRRGSLKTQSKSVAKARLHSFMGAAKAKFEGAVPFAEDGRELVTVADWMGEWLSIQQDRPRIKEGTKLDYAKKVESLVKSKLAGMVFGDVTAADARRWWRAECAEVEAVTANSRLRVLKAVFVLAVKRLGGSDPVAELERKPVRRKVMELPSMGTLMEVVESVRGQGKRFSEESANMIEFAAFSGLRPKELAAVCAEDLRGEWLVVRGGEDGTKNYQERIVPINPSLARLIEREGYRTRVGRLFSIKSPTRAMKAACDRLGLARVTPYTLRHFFATACLEGGVDVATVADWMGHKDGGVLLLKTYTHVRAAHSLRKAAGLKFD